MIFIDLIKELKSLICLAENTKSAALLIERHKKCAYGNQDYNNQLDAELLNKELSEQELSSLIDALVVALQTVEEPPVSLVWALGKTRDSKLIDLLVETAKANFEDEFVYQTLVAIEDCSFGSSWDFIEQVASANFPKSSDHAKSLLELKELGIYE